MAKLSLQDVTIFHGAYDLTSSTNQVEIATEAEALECTTFASGGWREHLGGLKSSTGTVQGFLDYDAASEDALVATFATSTAVTSYSVDGTAGSNAWLGRNLHTQLDRTAQVGQLAMFSATVKGSSPEGLVSGTVLLPKTTATSTANATGIQQGAISATQKGYASLHVFAASGTSPTLDVKVQSDDNGSFTSATDRITFTQATAATAEFASVAGAITDDYWRVAYTIGGTTPSVTFAVLFGIA